MSIDIVAQMKVLVVAHFSSDFSDSQLVQFSIVHDSAICIYPFLLVVSGVSHVVRCSVLLDLVQLS